MVVPTRRWKQAIHLSPLITQVGLFPIITVGSRTVIVACLLNMSNRAQPTHGTGSIELERSPSLLFSDLAFSQILAIIQCQNSLMLITAVM